MLFEEGQRDEARTLQQALAGLNSAITARFGVSGLKYAMDQSGIYGGSARRPWFPLNDTARAEIDRLLAAARSQP